MFNPYHSYRSLRRYKQIILTVVRFGFGELVGRLKLFNLLKIHKRSKEKRISEQASRSLRFRLMLEQLGPTFIKLGQILSTRPDLLPPDIVAELAHLQDRVAPTGWDTIRNQLGGEFEDYFEETFEQFDTEPVASASIAQVYAARLKSGRKVAVKIVRPGTKETFRDDLVILEHLAHLIHVHIEEARYWDPHAIINQIRLSVNHELDMRHEGRNAEIFRANFSGKTKVHVPKIFWEHSKDNILVMEYIEGRRISEFFEPGADPQICRELARNGADIVLRQIFDHGFFQADPHPGNAFVMPGNVICFLDFGMFGRLDRGSQDILCRVLQAVVKKDIDRLFKAMGDLGILPEEGNSTELRIAVIDLIEQYHGLPLKQINVRQMLGDIVQLISRYHIGIRNDFLFLIKALSTIEATGRNLDQDFDMLEQIKPFVQAMVVERHSPQYLIDETRRFAEDVLRLTHESPEHLLGILRNIRSGRFKMEIEHKGLEQPLNQWDRMSDKIVLGLIIAAIIIASAVVSHAEIGPSVFGYPVIGGLGFLVGMGAGLWIVFHILRNK